MKKITDRIVLGLLCGLIAEAPKLLSNEILVRLGLVQRRFGELVAGIFLTSKETKTKSGILFGELGDVLMNSFLGIPIVYVLSFTGKDNYLLKSWMTSMVSFGIIRGMIANVGPGKAYPRDSRSNILMTASSSLWGLLVGWLAIRMGDSALFKPKPMISLPEGVVEGILDKDRSTEQRGESGA